MRCLYCGKRLALLKKLTHGEFCSAAHRKLYAEEEQQAALARLINEPKRVDRSRKPAAAARPAPAAPEAAEAPAAPSLPGFCNCVPAERTIAPQLISYAEPILPAGAPCVVPETGSRTLPIVLAAEAARCAATDAPEAPDSGEKAAKSRQKSRVRRTPPSRERTMAAPVAAEHPPALPANAAAEEPPPAATLLPLAAHPVAGGAAPLPAPEPERSIPQPFVRLAFSPLEPGLAAPPAVRLGCLFAAAAGSGPAARIRSSHVPPPESAPVLPRVAVRLWIEASPLETGEALATAGSTRPERPAPVLAAAVPAAVPAAGPAPVSGLRFENSPRLPGDGPAPDTVLPPAGLLRIPLPTGVPERDLPPIAGRLRPYPARHKLEPAGYPQPPETCSRQAAFSPPACAEVLALPVCTATVPAKAGPRAGSGPVRALPPAPFNPAWRPPVAARGLAWFSRQVPFPGVGSRGLEWKARTFEAAPAALVEALIPAQGVEVSLSPGWRKAPSRLLRLPAGAVSASPAPRRAPAWLRELPSEAVLPVSGLRPDTSSALAAGSGCAGQALRRLRCKAAPGVILPVPSGDLLRSSPAPVLPAARPGCVPAFGPPRGVRLYPLGMRTALCEASRPSAAPVPCHPEPVPRVPRSRLAVTEIERRGGGGAALAALPARHVPEWMRFWKVAPADLRWLALVVPLVLLVAFWSSGHGPIQVVKTGESRSEGVAAFFGQRWENLRENIMQRAAVSLQDDFRSGLGDWEGVENWGRQWQYDPAGFVLTGPLAIYTPSKRLSDYTFEFLGQIETRSLNWVFRAADLQNYYAMKIVLTNSGPLPQANLVRYAVIKGKAGKPVQTRLPLTVSADTLYRVRTEVRDSDFSVTIQDQVVASWSDSRLKSGGIGFFSERGERGRLRWVQVAHQYDALGRLCALLAPYPVQATDPSWSGK